MKERTALIFVFLANLIFGQNPMTDSDFYKAFPKSEIIDYSKDAYDLDLKICNYLISDTSFKNKMAVIDAFNTESETDAGQLFFEFLKSKYGFFSISEIKSNEQKLILAYLLMTSNIDISKTLLKEIEATYSNRLSFNLIKFFVNSFEYIDTDKCKIWLDYQKLDNSKFVINDFDKKSMYLIAKKVDLLKDFCSKEKLATTQTKRHFIRQKTFNNSFDLNYENGVYSINLEINNAIKLDFIFDSGASLVLIPEDVFRVLVRMKKIKKEHMLGVQKFTIADGNTMEKPVFLIKSLKIGHIEVKDVKASVGELNSDLLLGQSFQKKFKVLKIDNNNNKLIIEQ